MSDTAVNVLDFHNPQGAEIEADSKLICKLLADVRKDEIQVMKAVTNAQVIIERAICASTSPQLIINALCVNLLMNNPQFEEGMSEALWFVDSVKEQVVEQFNSQEAGSEDT